MSAPLDLGHLLATLPVVLTVSERDRQGRAPIPPDIQLKGGEYVVKDLLGCGSFGLIYHAVETRTGQQLAIKEFFPLGFRRASKKSWRLAPKEGEDGELSVLRAQFEEEFRVLERFERPGIVKVYDLFEENGGLFLVMERLEGATLEDVLEQHETLDEGLALWLIRRLVSTLETIHLSGLVHGDIKPENIFLTRKGQLILLDFGAVNHYLTRDKDAPRFLTPGYAPPEQYQANKKPDPASDLYAVGATLYELLTGSPPPDAVKRTQGAKLQTPNRRGVTVSQQTMTVLSRTLALAQEKRPASAHALLGLLPQSEVQALAFEDPWKELEPWTGHKQAIRRLELSSDGKFLTSADKGGQLRLWSLEHDRCMGVIELESEIADTAIHPEDKYLAVGLAGGRIDLIEFASGRSVGTLREGTPPVSALKFSPDGSFLVVGLFDGRVELLNMAHRSQKQILRAHDAPINSVSFSPSGRLLALSSNDRSASIWDLKSGRRIRSFEEHHRPVQMAKFSEDGRFLITGGSDMSLRVFDVKRGDEFRRLKGHEAMVWDILHLDSPEHLVTCSADRTIRLWDMTCYREMHKTELSDGWLCSMKFEPNTRILYVAGVDKTIFRLQVQPLESLATGR